MQNILIKNNKLKKQMSETAPNFARHDAKQFNVLFELLRILLVSNHGFKNKEEIYKDSFNR